LVSHALRSSADENSYGRVHGMGSVGIFVALRDGTGHMNRASGRG